MPSAPVRDDDQTGQIKMRMQRLGESSRLREELEAAGRLQNTALTQGKVTVPVSSNPKDQGAMMGKMMSLYMPFLLGYFALTFASGLSIYFITGNVIGIAQYALLGKVNWRALLPGKKSSVPVPVRKK